MHSSVIEFSIPDDSEDYTPNYRVPTPSSCPVNSWNEWDPLEEVVVGTCQGAASLAMEPVLVNLLGQSYAELARKGFSDSAIGNGKAYNRNSILAAEQQLDNFVRVLENEGITVRRPDVLDHALPIKTPDFEVPVGNSATCPRDTVIVFGNEIVESPMSIRGRFFEYRPYRTLIRDYWRSGAEWTTAPKPLMQDSFYKSGYPSFDQPEKRWGKVHGGDLGLTEDDPAWDAADFLRMGKDVIGQHSLATNLSGIEWVRRHLAPKGIRVHSMQFNNMKPRHIDDTLIALRPGIAVNSLETPPLKDGLKLFTKSGWRVFRLPHSNFSRSLNINTLSLDDRTILCEEKEIEAQKFFEDLGCRVLVIPFSKVYSLGGSFHCCTVDIRRRGTLQSYFPHLDALDAAAASVGLQ